MLPKYVTKRYGADYTQDHAAHTDSIRVCERIKTIK